MSRPLGIREEQKEYTLDVVHPTDRRDSGRFQHDSRMMADIATADAAKEGYEFTLVRNNADGTQTLLYTSYPTD